MITIYTYTRDPYTQIPSWPGYTILPSDGDPFIAQSVNLYEKAIQDRNMYVWEGALKNPTMNGAIRMHSVDGVSIKVYPFIVQTYSTMSGDYILAKYNTITTITAANLLVPGSFTADTWYYVYLQTNLDGTTQIVINTGVPHQYLIYKDLIGFEDKAFKFLGSFITDGLSKIRPFLKDGQRVSYINSIRVLTNGTSLADVIDLTLTMPPYSRFVTLEFSYFNGKLSSNKLFVAGRVFPGLEINMQGDTNLKRFIHSTSIEYNVSSLQDITYGFLVSGPNVSKLNIDILGYRE